jgi:hypothetical protein
MCEQLLRLGDSPLYLSKKVYLFEVRELDYQDLLDDVLRVFPSSNVSTSFRWVLFYLLIGIVVAYGYLPVWVL